MNVVIYARYSSHSQREESIEGQLKVCYEFAQRNGYAVIGEYIDRALSGTTDNRPQFLKMVNDSAKKHFSGVLVYQLDRFARNRYDSATYKAKLKKNGVRVLSARENITDDASGILVEGLLEAMAEYYSVELSQKVRRGREISASKFRNPGGVPALGYRIDEDKKFAIDSDKAPIVRKIFEMYANGDSITKINEFMNAQGIKTSKGMNFNKSSLKVILRNKKYIGVYTYKGKETKGGVPRIVSDELFNRVQEKLYLTSLAPARGRKAEYLLSGKLFCGHCNDTITGISATSKTKALHYYYVCSSMKKKVCKKKYVKRDPLENLVVAECRRLLTDENIDKIAQEVVAICDEEREATNVKRLQKLLADNDKQKLNLLNSLKLCDVDSVRKTIFDELARMDTEKSELEAQIAIEEAQLLDLTVPEIKFFLSQLKKGNVDSVKYRRTLINVFVNKIFLYDERMIILFNTGERAIEFDSELLNTISKGRFNSNAGENYRTSSCLSYAAPLLF
jgi:DNA invertase Pin-like site-specific DNA recombinase